MSFPGFCSFLTHQRGSFITESLSVLQYIQREEDRSTLCNTSMNRKRKRRRLPRRHILEEGTKSPTVHRLHLETSPVHQQISTNLNSASPPADSMKTSSSSSSSSSLSTSKMAVMGAARRRQRAAKRRLAEQGGVRERGRMEGEERKKKGKEEEEEGRRS